MIKLLGFWLAWRTIRLIARVGVIIALVAHPLNRQPGADGHGKALLTQLRHATGSLAHWLERAFKP
jgi:hypothetical protein